MDKRTWAEVDLDAIAHNIKEIRKITNPNAKIMAVVKADAYGHGFLEVAKTLLENGADRLAVAVLQEGKQLRSRGVTVPILILGASGEEAVEDLINFDITPSVFTYEFAKALSYEAERKEKVTKIHIKIDTGMSRIGFLAGENNEEIVDEIYQNCLILKSKVYSHILQHLTSTINRIHFCNTDVLWMFATDLKKKDLIFRLSIFATVPE